MTALYFGLYVSLELTRVCIVDEEGRLVRQRSLCCLPRSHHASTSLP